MANMGLDFGLNTGEFCKRNFRWLFFVPGVCGDNTPGVKALPPEKSARPAISFKEIEVKHLIEDVYYPGKPDWKPISLVLYDLSRDPYAKNPHPVFNWLRELYDPKAGDYWEPNRYNFIKYAELHMYNGCGDLVEMWLYEDAWPQSINFQNLDMADSNVTTCDITIRYARAYVVSLEKPRPQNNQIVWDHSQ